MYFCIEFLKDDIIFLFVFYFAYEVSIVPLCLCGGAILTYIINQKNELFITIQLYVS